MGCNKNHFFVEIVPAFEMFDLLWCKFDGTIAHDLLFGPRPQQMITLVEMLFAQIEQLTARERSPW